MTFFFRFDQALVVQNQHVLLHPPNLLTRQPAALNVHGDAGQMGRSCLPALGSRIAIMTAKLFLPLRGPHRGIDLDLAVKLLVVGLAQVFDEVAGPGAAIAPAGIEPGIEA